MEQQEIAEFYDEYPQRQLKTGANERLFSLFKRMPKAGLHSESTVLELGCGVGIFTKLLAKKIKNGQVEAVDLSPKSIEVARKLVPKKNINFQVGDVVNYKPALIDPDFITLLDVIEHIPLEDHNDLFKNISKICSEKTQIIINYPNPRYIEFCEKNDRKGLQIIDQTVEFAKLATTLENNGLEIIFYEKYSIWEVEDYDFLIVRKRRNFKLNHLSDQRNFVEKAQNKTRNFIDKFRYE